MRIFASIRFAFLAAIVLVTALPSGVEAQPAARVPRIGILVPGTMASAGHLTQAFIEGMRALGYVDGKDIGYDPRYADGSAEKLEQHARTLVNAKIDLIFALGTLGVLTAKKATSTIPVVFALVSDPIDSGVVRSLAAPGGNLAGISLMSAEMASKRVEILHEAAPKRRRIGVLHNPNDPASVAHLVQVRKAATALRKDVLIVEVNTPDDFDEAFSKLEKWPADALAIMETGFFFRNRKLLLDRAAKNRWPTVNSTKEYAESGGLISYGADYADSCRRSAYYADRILKGAKPADLPVQQPTKFEFVINMKTAKAMRISFPPSILLRADRVIE